MVELQELINLIDEYITSYNTEYDSSNERYKCLKEYVNSILVKIRFIIANLELQDVTDYSIFLQTVNNIVNSQTT